MRGNYKACIVLQSAAKLQFRGEFAKVRKTRKVPGQSVVRLTLVPAFNRARADAMMQGTDGSTLEKSEVRAHMRSMV